MALILGPTLAQQVSSNKHHSNCLYLFMAQREMALILGPTLAQQAPTRAGKGGMGKGEERVGEAGRAGDGAAETQLLCLPHLDRAGDGGRRRSFSVCLT